MTIRQLSIDLNLASAAHPTLILPDGRRVATHFHLTEIGFETREFIDCGSTRRSKNRAVLQLLVGNDVDHLLTRSKLAAILKQGCQRFPRLSESRIIIELTGEQTIERYSLARVLPNLVLELAPLATACLAPETCNLDPTEAAASRPAACASSNTESDCC